MKRLLFVAVLGSIVLLFMAAAPSIGQTAPASKALAIYVPNPAYFQSADGKPVVLIGDYQASPTGPTAVPIDPNYDFEIYLDTLKSNGLNFAKVWIWYGVEAEYDSETSFDEYHRFNLLPYLRVGPGLANDGRPKYDLSQFNPIYFDRLAAFCAAAHERGIYLQLVLIDGWIFRVAPLWKFHAYNRANNISGVDGDPKATGVSTDPEQGSCSLGNTKLLEVEKAYLRRLLDTVNDYDNLLFEVSNENYYNLDWELHVARFVHGYEKGKARQHLVMPLDLPDHDYGGVNYGANSTNDHTKSWKTWDLPQLHERLMAARGLKQPLIFDPDGIESNDNPVQRAAFWTAFASGGHVNYTDYSFQPEVGGDERGVRRAETRRQLGHIAAFTRQIRFWEMRPAEIVRSGDGYALASQREAAVYVPKGGNIELALQDVPGNLRVKWINPRNGLSTESPTVAGGKVVALAAPDSRDWVLFLQNEEAGR